MACVRWNESRSFVLSVFEHLSSSAEVSSSPPFSLASATLFSRSTTRSQVLYVLYVRALLTYVPMAARFLLVVADTPSFFLYPYLSLCLSPSRSLYGNEDVLFVKRRELPPLCFEGEAERGQRAAREIRFYPAAVAETFFPYLGITSKLE